MDLKHFAKDPMAFLDALVIPAAGGAQQFKDCMAPHQREWFEALAPALLAVSKGDKPPVGRFWTERTKGGSKDSDAACALLYLLAFSRQKLDMQVGAADRDQALELKKAAVDILRLNDWLAARIEVQSWTLHCRATGSECTIISTDVASSHGARPDVVCLNELSHVGKEEFAQNLLDNASKKPHGLVIVATNAGLNPSWQYNWREMARQSDRWHFHAFSEPAPWLSPGEVEEAERRNSNLRFQRLYWGVWISAAGDALDPAVLEAAFRADVYPQHQAEPGWQYVAGVDAGITRDATALVVLAVRRDHAQHGRIRLAHCRVWLPSKGMRVDLSRVEDELVDLHGRFGFKVINYDPYELRYLASRLQAGGVGKLAGETRFGKQRREPLPLVEVPFTGKNLANMATAVLEAFNDFRVELFPDPNVKHDLEHMTVEEKSYGHRLSFPRDERGHGDAGTALALAMLAASELASKRLIVAGAVGDGSGLVEVRFPAATPHADYPQRPRTALDMAYDRLANTNEHLRKLAEGGSDQGGQEQWRREMRRIGRLR